MLLISTIEDNLEMKIKEQFIFDYKLFEVLQELNRSVISKTFLVRDVRNSAENEATHWARTLINDQEIIVSMGAL